MNGWESFCWEPSNLFILIFTNNILPFEGEWQQWFHFGKSSLRFISLWGTSCEWNTNVSPSSTTDSPFRPEQSLGSYCLGTGICTLYSLPHIVRAHLTSQHCFIRGPQIRQWPCLWLWGVTHSCKGVGALSTWGVNQPNQTTGCPIGVSSHPAQKPHAYLMQVFVAMHTCTFWVPVTCSTSV